MRRRPILSSLIEFKFQGLGPFSKRIKKVEKEIKQIAKKVNDLCGLIPNYSYPSIFCCLSYISIKIIEANLSDIKLRKT